MHALRHAYASVLLGAGEAIEALAEYLGAPGPGRTSVPRVRVGAVALTRQRGKG